MAEKKTSSKKSFSPKTAKTESKTRTFSRIADRGKNSSHAKHSAGTGPRNNHK